MDNTLRKVRLGLLLLIVMKTVIGDANAEPQDCLTPFYSERLEAYEICKKEVEETGTAEVLKVFADMHYWGWGTALAQDQKEAILWYKRAAKKGSADAKFNLGVMYEQGLGTQADYGRALQWYKSAAEDGHVNAEFNLGNMYSKGAGTAVNQGLAFFWYKRAAEQGQPEAQLNLANRYARGEGIAQNMREAYKWYLIAEQNGIMSARKNIIHIEKFMEYKDVEEAKKMAQDWRFKTDPEKN